MKTLEFPYKPFGRIAKKAGARRISESGLRALRNIVLEEAEERAREIVMLARHAGRKTVMKEDVVFVTGRKPPI